MTKYFNTMYKQISGENLITARQKHFHFFLMLLLVACNHPTEHEDYDRIFPVILESDLDYAIVKSDGTVWTWGGNSTGQLGNGTMTPSEQPVQALNLKNIISLDLCEGAANAADEKGNIYFWGNRLLWAYDTVVVIPKKISSLNEIKQLQAISPSGVDLLKNDGTVWEIEWDYHYPTKYVHPNKVNGMDNIKRISGFLALKDNGELCEFPDRAWIGPEIGGLDSEIVSNVKDFYNMTMRWTIVLKNDSTVWAWGKNGAGCLGDGTFNDNPIPTRIDTLKEVIAISVNGGRCLALKKDGSVWFWGLIHVDYDQGIELFQNKPICIEELNDIKIIHASAARKLLFMKSDSSFWNYDVYTREIQRIEL
jgi:alpha-tubulin suppressor-like RCC1 family protein